MKNTRKLGLAAVLLMVLLSFSACMPGGSPVGEGGGTVAVGDQTVSGGAQTAATGGTQATANQPAEQPAGLGFGMFIPIIIMFAVMWFLVIRPQRKQAKATKSMQEGLRVGDNVVTTSGFFGKIVGAGTDSFLVEFGETRGFKVWVRKGDIAGVKTPIMTPPSATPIPDEKSDK